MIFPRREDATNKELVLTIIDIQGFLERYGRSHTNWHETLNEVQARLEQADKVLEPKTGYWIRWYEKISYENSTEYNPHCKCSECNTEYDPHTSQFIKYCNVCGAKMESEE